MSQDVIGLISWLRSWFDDIYELKGGTPTPIFSYNIISSDYNPNIGSNVTITITVTDQSDNTVPNHSFTLNANGTNVSLTTNSNGVVTYSYTCSTWGVCRFSVNSYSTQINVTGQKKVKEGSNWSGVTYTLYVDEANRNATLVCNITQKNIASGISNYEMTGWIPSQYRPHSQKFIQGYRGNNNLFYIFYDGRVGVANLTSSTQTGVTLFAQIDWNY